MGLLIAVSSLHRRTEQALGADSPVSDFLFVVAWASRSSATFGSFIKFDENSGA
jgi:hypothetical protein